MKQVYIQLVPFLEWRKLTQEVGLSFLKTSDCDTLYTVYQDYLLMSEFIYETKKDKLLLPPTPQNKKKTGNITILD